MTTNDSSVGGKDLLISGDNFVAVLNADGTILSTFNGGQPLKITEGSMGRPDAGAAADDARDGNILVAARAVAACGVNVAKLSLAGTFIRT